MRKCHIQIPKEHLAVFCQRNHISKLALFGSVLRDDFTPSSDVDILVEFEDGHTPGFAFFTMEGELSKLLGRKVDLNTPSFISPYFRKDAMDKSETLYPLS